MKIDWKDEYSVGITNLDRDHQELFVFVNSLTDLKTKDIVEIQKSLKEVSRYIKDHFKEEEKHLLLFCDKKIAERHIKEHHDFLKSYTIFKIRIENEENVWDDFILFLFNWIKSHVLKIDIEDFKELEN
jgi:hemerythrin